MAVVRCPECRKPARVPESDRTLSVQCPHCRHTYQAPPSATQEVIDDGSGTLLYQPNGGF